jgi:Uma2 family endonuclease
MSAIPKPRKLSVAEYLAIEATAETKSEFYDGEMFAMAGASRFHNAVKDNLIGELYARLRGGPCRTYSSDMRVLVSATGLYTYPDIVIVCGEPQFEDNTFDTLLNPRIIIEVLSESTEKYDRTTKFRHYQQIESLQEYVLVGQDEPAIDRYVHQTRWDWLSRTFSGLDSELELVSVSAKVPLADIYAGVTFPDPPKPPAGRPR